MKIDIFYQLCEIPVDYTVRRGCAHDVESNNYISELTAMVRNISNDYKTNEKNHNVSALLYFGTPPSEHTHFLILLALLVQRRQ